MNLKYQLQHGMMNVSNHLDRIILFSVYYQKT